MKKINLLFVFILTLQLSHSQSYQTYGKEFWFGYMENIDLLFNGDPDFSVYVFSEQSGEGTLSAPATGLTIPFSYEANEIKEVILPTAIYYDEGSEDIENLGLKISLETDGQVFAFHYRLYFSEASLIYPTTALGIDYQVLANLDYDNSSDSPSSFLIIATEDNTEIEITPSGLTLGLRPANVAYTIELNAGQSYQVQSLEDLSGSKIASTNNKKIAVFGGAKKAHVQCLMADNHLYDQNLPTNHASTSFPLIPFKGQSLSTYKVVAVENNTQVFLNGDLEVTLNAGESDAFFLTEPMMLTADQPVHVAQFNPSQGCTGSGLGDPTMLTLAPVQMRIYNTALYNFDRFEETITNSKRFVTLFTETDNVAGIALNGQNINSQFELFPGNEAYSFARIEVDAGSMLLSSPNGVMAYAYGFGEYDAYAYHLAYETPNLSSTQQAHPEADLITWPQPFTDRLNLNNKGQYPIKNISLTHVNGQHITNFESLQAGKSIQENFPGLAKGIYILRYSIEGHFFAKKLVRL